MTGIKLARTDAVSQTLAANDLYSYNKLSELDKLKPQEKKFPVKTNKFNQNLPAYSVTVLKIPFVNK
jgi:alpha-L-arabinofuranosidase